MHTRTMTRGDLSPDIIINIGDATGNGNFNELGVQDLTVVGEQDGLVVFSRQPTSYSPSGDGKRAQVRLSWQPGDTDVAGVMWVTVSARWPGEKPQHFPEDGALRLDINRAPGDP